MQGIISKELQGETWEFIEIIENTASKCDLCSTPLQHQWRLEGKPSGHKMIVGHECAKHLLGEYAMGIKKRGSWTQWKLSAGTIPYKRVNKKVVCIIPSPMGYGISIKDQKTGAIEWQEHNLCETQDEMIDQAPVIFHQHMEARKKARLEQLSERFDYDFTGRNNGQDQSGKNVCESSKPNRHAP